MLFIAGCGQQSTTVVKLPSFSVTNTVVAGKLSQVLQITNGLSLYFTQTNIVVWFRKDSKIMVEFNPETLKPLSILLGTSPSGDQPGQLIFDSNADGIPDAARIKDASGTQQLFYRGEWYTREAENGGTQSSIIIDGKKQRVHFDGRRWVEVLTNSNMGTVDTVFTNHF